MAIDISNPALQESTGAPAQPELLVSAALHLMSHYSANAAQSGACVKLASVIERHLKALSMHNDLTPVLRATCQQLSEQWAGVVEQAMPPPAKATLLGRFMHGARSH